MIGNYRKAMDCYKKAIQLEKVSGGDEEVLGRLKAELVLNKAKDRIVDGIMIEVRKLEDGWSEEVEEFRRAKSEIKKALSHIDEKKQELRSMLSLIETLENYIAGAIENKTENKLAYLEKVMEKVDGASMFILSPNIVKEILKGIKNRDTERRSKNNIKIMKKAREEELKKVANLERDLFKIQMDVFFYQRDFGEVKFFNQTFEEFEEFSERATEAFEKKLEEKRKGAEEGTLKIKEMGEELKEKEADPVRRELEELF